MELGTVGGPSRGAPSFTEEGTGGLLLARLGLRI